MSRIYANINPSMLRWARERAHYSESDLARKFKRYPQWESGEARPTMNQFRDLAQMLQRPLITFFMVDPPEEPEFLTQMRRLPGTQPGQESPELTLQVRQVLEMREMALGLYGDLGEDPPSLNMLANVNQDPEALAPRIREWLGLSVAQQASWVDAYQAIREFRTALEGTGILVFQIPKVPLDEMRGFALALEPLPIIGLNSSDSARARVFTLIHELGHVLLRDSVLHSLQEGWFRLSPANRTEAFCNALAAAVLVPGDDLISEAAGLGKSARAQWGDADIRELISRYHVSGAVIIRRLRTLRLISESSYGDLRQEYDGFRAKAERPGGGDFYRNKIAQLGTLLPGLAFRCYYGNKITASDLSTILGLKVKKLGRLEQKVLGFNYGFEA